MESGRSPRLRLFDILNCVHQNELTSTAIDAEALSKDIVRYRAIERWLEIISEASRHVGDDLKQREPHIDWRGMAAFGNVTLHGYEAVDAQIVWSIITLDLPILKAAAQRLYQAVKEPADPWPDAKPE